MKKYITIALALTLSGCSLFNQHAQLMDTVRGTLTEAAQRIGDSGMSQAIAGGQLINPGIRIQGGIIYFGEASYVGVSGQVQGAMQGQMNRELTPAERQAIVEIYHNSTMSRDMKDALISNIVSKAADRWASSQPTVIK